MSWFSSWGAAAVLAGSEDMAVVVRGCGARRRGCGAGVLMENPPF
jgi:hypothetical protein